MSPWFGAGRVMVGDSPGATSELVSSEEGWKFTKAPSTREGPAKIFSLEKASTYRIERIIRFDR